MPDKAHVLSAIKFFNYVSSEDEERLARNIKKKINEYNMKDEVHVSDKNRFSKYFKEPKNEAVDYSALDKELALDCTIENSIYFNGYLDDVLDLSETFTGEDYYNILKEMKYKISNIKDLPILELTAYNQPADLPTLISSVDTNKEGYTVFDINIESKSLYESRETDKSYYEYVIEEVVYSIVNLTKSLLYDIQEDTKVHLGPKSDNKDQKSDSAPAVMDMDQIIKSFKNKTSSNIKRQYTRRINKLKRHANDVKD
jgi:hypothetical protein